MDVDGISHNMPGYFSRVLLLPFGLKMTEVVSDVVNKLGTVSLMCIFMCSHVFCDHIIWGLVRLLNTLKFMRF